MGFDSVSGRSRSVSHANFRRSDRRLREAVYDGDEMCGRRVNEQSKNANKREQQKQTKTLRMIEQDTMPMLREIRGRARGWDGRCWTTRSPDQLPDPIGLQKACSRGQSHGLALFRDMNREVPG